MKKTLLFTISLISFNCLFSQLQEGKYGVFLPSNDTIRILVLYAEVQYDGSTQSCTEPSIFQTNGWSSNPNGTLPPADADSLFDPVVPNDGVLKGLMSGIHQQASLNSYYVLGDYYPSVLKVPCNAGAGSVGAVITALNNEPSVYDPINGDSTLFTARGLPLRAFDNYDIENGMPGQPKTKAPNGKIDAIFIVWRNATIIGDPGCTKGYALTPTLATSTSIKNMLGSEAAANFNACGDAKHSFSIFLGEYFHALYGGNNWHTAGGAGSHTFMGIPHVHGFSTQASSVMKFVNGFERWFVDWKHPTKNFDISVLNQSNNEVSSDWSIQNHSTDSIFKLRDFTTTGDAIRIKIPHLENTTSLPQYLWIENRQMNTRFDEWYNHGCHDDNNATFPRGTPGLYMYLQVGREQKKDTNIYNVGSGSYIFPVTAEGNYDFNYRYDLAQPGIDSICGNWGSANIPIDKSTSFPNPFTGHSDLYHIFDAERNGTLTDNIGQNQTGFSEVINNTVVHNAAMFGDWEDAFSFATGNTKIGLGTNPSSTPVYTRQTTYSSQSSSNVLAPFENATIYLNGISVEILAEIAGEITVKVKWDDFEINNDVRWCGNVVLQNDSNDPNATVSRINLKSGNKIELEQGTSATKPTPFIQTGNSYLYADPSILTLKSGTVTTIENGSELNVKKGSTLRIESGATIVVKGNGKISIDSAAYLCVAIGATIVLQDSNSLFFVHNEASLGINPLLNITPVNCTNLICDLQTSIVSGNGILIHKSIADAGANQVLCQTSSGNNILGGNPTAILGMSTPGYTYSWSPPFALDNPTLANPTITSPLAAPSFYIVTVTDTNGCVGTDTITITSNPTNSFTMNATDAHCVGSGTEDGTATAHPPCGNPIAYTYQWNDDQNQTTPTAINLTPGVYSVTVTDTVNNVTYTDSITVNASTDTTLYDYINPIINTNTTWALDFKIKGEVKVKSGATLTIRNASIEFAYDTIIDFNLPYARARITIENGGKVVLIGATLTGCGGGTWDGIEIWGNPDSSQLSSAQGQLFSQIHSNTSTSPPTFTKTSIENAVYGVKGWRTELDNTFLPPTFGGIANVTNTIFKNNKYPIVLRDYNNFVSSSRINNNEFIYDGTTFFTYDPQLEEMEFIRLTNMRFSLGGLFGGNLKSNIFNTDTIAFAMNERGIAVKLINSRAAIKTNTFNNMRLGIDAATINSLNALEIEANTFNNCKGGTFIKAHSASKITYNTFNIPFSATDTTYGLYMLETALYSVMENTFNGNANETVGLYILNTDTANASATNDVYKNTFNNLGFAAFGNGENSDALNLSKGLTFKCNTFVGNDLDIITTIAPGISIQQGAPGNAKTPAGNEFVTSCGLVTDGELFNTAAFGQQTNAYSYWHHSDATFTPSSGCYTPVQVDPNNANQNFIASGSNESCPVRIFGSLRSLQLAIEQNNELIGDLGNSLNGGNGTTLLDAVIQGNMSGGQLKNVLLTNTPLSSELLIALINSTYNGGILKEVLLANSPLSNTVLVALLQKTPPLPAGTLKELLTASAPLSWQVLEMADHLNLPNGIIANIHQNQELLPNPPSETQVIESSMAGLVRENNLLRNEMIRVMLYDTTREESRRFDSIVPILDSALDERSNLLLIEALLQNNNSTQALQEVIALEQAGKELPFCQLQRAVMALENHPEKLMGIKTDLGLKNQVTHVSQSHKACGATHASNLLELVAEKSVKENFVFPITSSSSSRMGVTLSAGNKKHEEQYNEFNLYPNPNQGKFTLTYNYENKEQKELIIINLTGAIVYTAVLANENSDMAIDVKNLPEGLYFVVIKTTKGEKLYQTKIAIIK